MFTYTSGPNSRTSVFHAAAHTPASLATCRNDGSSITEKRKLMSSPSSALAAAVALGGSKNELIMTAWTVPRG